ncbi:DEAD/DEAH box helicase family protein [Enterococcus hirae]|nr:DEAD/DEAH box helicase family protein [Enterococcus hirae]EMF0393472.1 DEAD/DEAH box helicase family protein [Enterococcus hirae]
MNYQKYKELGNLFKETFLLVVSDKNSLFDFFNQVQIFHKYDIYEQIFIYGQKPNATHIADFDTWKKLGRFVKKGEKSIAVLSQSTGKINIKHYFDLSQTDGKKLDFPDYTLEKNDWNLLVSQEIEDLIDETVDFTEEPDIRRLSIEIGLFLAKNKSIGSEVIDITEQEFTMLQSLPNFFKVMNYANEVNRLISKEILVYKRERMNEHESKILRERDRSIDTRSRVSQLSTGEIRENSCSQITGRESRGVSNQTSRGRFDEVGTRDQQKSVEQSKRIDGSVGRSQSTDISPTSEFRGSVEDTNAISGTSNRTRNERDSIEVKSNIDIKDLEEKQSSESFFVEKNHDYEEITPDFTEEELNNILRRGSGVEGGKIRIYHLYQRTLSKKERASFLKDEYGWSGSTLDIQGSSFSMMDCRPSKGITVIKKINNEDYERVMKWSEVEERIGLLIRQNEYLTEEELKLVQSKKEESVKEELSQMDTEAEELTLFDLEEIKTEGKPVITEGYGTEVAFIPKIEAKKETINHDETMFEQIYRNKTNGFSFENIDVVQFYPSKAREKIKANLEAIRLSKEISQIPGRIATDKEREVLAKYVGWGGLAAIFDERDDQYLSERNQLKVLLSAEDYRAARESVLTAYYTDPRIIQAIYQKIEAMGFKGGTILDPSTGTGNFFSAMPKTIKENSTLYGVELDPITGKIAQQLHPDANIEITGFEKTPLNKDKFDLVISNIPFDNFKIEDENYSKKYAIHDYFIKKALDSTKEGGIVAVITSMSTMDKSDSSIRREYAEKADLLGAVRLPSNAFKKIAGTDVVTDILFFQKNFERELEYSPSWVFTGTDPEIPEVSMNNYFIRHKEMVLGELAVKNFRGQTLIVKSHEGDLIDYLNQAFLNFNGQLAISTETEVIDLVSVEKEGLEKEIPMFNYGVIGDEIFFNDAGELEKYAGSKKSTEQMKRLIEIKEALLSVIELQRNTEYTQEELQASLNQLNDCYDGFVATYGSINKVGKIFDRDEYYPLLKSIEEVQEDGTVRKGDIFFQATIRQIEEITQVDTAQEALQLSINRQMKVDLDYMMSIYPKDKETIIDELEDSIFINPTKYQGDIYGNVWETREEYLSGDVKQKLVEAKLAIESYPEIFQKNVSALEQSQPTPLKAGDIDYSLGATWIPTEIYQSFMYELFETPQYMQRSGIIQLEYDSYASKYFIRGKSRDENALTTNKYGTKRANAYLILENSLNLLKVEVRDRVIDNDGKKRYELNPKETMYARTKQEELQETFKSWVMNHSEVLEELHAIYEERFNRIVSRTYDGSKLEFPGLNQKITLRPAQQNVVARILHEGRALMAHSVGAGKTLSMITAGMMMKEHGLIKKPLYVVPNHLVGDFGTELLRFYPAQKVLITTKKDFEKSKRKEFVSRIAVGEYDAVIIGHSQFEKITLSPERQKKMLQEEIDRVSEAVAEYQMNNEEESWSIKQMISFEKRLNERLEKLNKQDKKDHMIYFEDLGVDFLFVDEAHVYKNLYSYTKLSNVAGVNSSNSLRASDMEMKVKYLLEENNQRGVVFATGTPISNSMSEMFTMQKYLQPDILEAYGVSHFDAWASTFGEIISSLEINPEGSGYQMKNRFAKFHNLPELMTMFNLVADIQTPDMLKLPVPKLKTGKAQIVVTEPIQYQKDKVEELGDRAMAVREKKVMPEEDNMLKITNEAKLMALDPRLLEDYDEEKYDSDELKQTKLATCANKVFAIWKETEAARSTQMIFSDSGTPNPKKFNVYDEMKRLLMDKGIPEEEIVFIHDAKNDKQREAMFEKMRKGSIRIMLGSTSKVGTGTNIQNKMIAAHHIDCPWRPSDIEQRDGRIIRQGNENKKVQIYRYVTKGTFDSFLWQIQEQKQTYISQVMSGKAISRSVDELSETVLDASEVKALATGNPLIAEKMKLDNEISRLRMLQSAFLNEQESLKRNVEQNYPKKMQEIKHSITQLEKDVELSKQYSNNEFQVQLLNMTYDSRTEATQKLEQLCQAYNRSEEFVEVGAYQGFSIHLKRSEMQYGQLEMKLQSEGGRYTTLIDPQAGIGMVRRIENIVQKLPERILEKQEQLKETEEKLEIAKQQLGQPFSQEQELKEKVAEQTRINTEIECSLSKKKGSQSVTDEIEETVEYEEERYTEEYNIEEIEM